MANDILIINESKDINDINIVCSTQANGSSSVLLSQDNYPLDLTIDNIQSKFDHKFDELTYYTRYNNSGISPSTTPTVTPTRTVTPTPTITITPTATVTPTVTPTITVTPTVTPTITSSSPIVSPSATPTATVTPTVTPTATVTPTPTTTVTPTPTITPTPSATAAVPITTNSCNFNNCADWDGLNGNVTTIGSNGISSAYNAHDMNGNLWEWNEAIIGASTRCIRGAAWNNGGTYLAAISRTSQNTTYFLNNIGLRLATLTNPYSFNTFVDIIDTGNTQDSNGYGAVSYSYKINQYLVTNDQYIEFLNAVAQTDDNGLYPSIMSTDLRSGIIRSGTNGSYAYAARTNMNNKPVNFMSWYNTARFANWLHNNKPNGLQNNSTTEGGAYQLTGNTGQPSRDFGAKYFIPTENEWYKAAYYKAGSTNAGYWKYATRSATLPSCVSASVNGNGVTS